MRSEHAFEAPGEVPEPTRRPDEAAARRLLAGLDAEQRAAVVDPSRRLAVVAGAGAGKTRVLTRRVAHRVLVEGVDPARVLVLTFTRRAAGELGARLGALGLRERVGAGTFHAVALAELRQHRADRGKAPPVLLTRRARVVAPLVAALGPDALPVGAVVREIEWAKASGIGPDGYRAAARAARRPLAGVAGDVADLFAGYERDRRRRGVVDFDDLLAELAAALDDDPAWARARRWWWRHLHVDEYQDVTPIQLAVLRGLLGDDGDLFVVGDDRQSIYGFAGARAGMVGRFPDDLPGGSVLALGTNHRSTRQVVALAGAVLGEEPAHAPAGDGPEPTAWGRPDPAAEAAAVATALLARSRRGLAWADQAVLARTHGRLDVVAAALARAGIPHRRAGNDAPLARAEVRAVLDDLRVRDATAGRPGLAALLADLELDVELDESTAVAPAGAQPPPPAQAVAVVLGHAREYLALAGTRPDLDGLEAHLATVRPADDALPAADAVTLATYHQAKGLEWEAVHLVGTERGLVPLPGGDPDEEARVLHVGVTRARAELVLSWADARADGRPAGPSPLLDRVGPLPDHLDTPDRQAPPGALDAARAALVAGRARAQADEARVAEARRAGPLRAPHRRRPTG